MQFSVVIPVFNEAQSLAALQARLAAVMDKVSGEYEIIYVDDGSTDSSPEVLKQLAKKFAAVRIISFKNNQGQSAALHAGFKSSCGQQIITLDADGQNPPEEIEKLLKFCPQFDCVAGIREKRKDSLMRKIASAVAKSCRRLILGDRTCDIGCSLRVFRREIIDRLPSVNNFHRFFTFLVRLKGFSVKEVAVEHAARRFGESKYGNFTRLIQGIFDLWGVFWFKKRIMRYEISDER